MLAIRARCKCLRAIFLAGILSIFVLIHELGLSVRGLQKRHQHFEEARVTLKSTGEERKFVKIDSVDGNGIAVQNSSQRIVDISNVSKCPTSPLRLFFLKTHKTGSSTIANILNRYVDRHNSTMCLPRGKRYSFAWPKLLGSESIQGTCGRVLTNHARYKRETSRKFFPTNESFYFSILREPVQQWESMFQFNHVKTAFGIETNGSGIQEFLRDPPEPENLCRVLCLAKNPNAFDFGLDHVYQNDSKRVKELIKMIERDFQLILIAEYFEESLVLLRRRLCWSFDDIVYLKLNARTKDEERVTLSEPLKAAIREWNMADVAIYEHFRDKLLQEIQREGPSFTEDLAEFRKRLRFYYEACVAGETTVISYGKRKVAGFVLKTNLTSSMALLCEQMTRQELQYVDYFRDMLVRNTLQKIRILQKQADQLMAELSGISLASYAKKFS